MTGKLLDTLSFPASLPLLHHYFGYFPMLHFCTIMSVQLSLCSGCKFLIHFATLPNSFCNRRSFLFTTTLAVPCRLAAPKRSCKSNFLKFLLRHAHAERQRARGKQGERERETESTHAAHSGNALPRHSTAFENQYDCDYAALAVSVSVSYLCECVSICVCVCVPVCICADDVARPARILKLTNCAL